MSFSRSGSTYGMTLEITKVSVSKALDTLGNDDFVNVAYVSRPYFLQMNCMAKEVHESTTALFFFGDFTQQLFYVSNGILIQ